MHRLRVNGLMPVAVIACFVGSALGQSVANGDFEGGFAGNGVALGWEYWRDANWTSASFADGTDHFQSPSHSQTMAANQPNPGPLTMGIWQKVNTSAGNDYTFSLKLRTQQENEQYSGEHLNVYLGLDPYGGIDAYSLNVVWFELSNTRNTWVTEQKVVQSRGAWTTVYIRIVRKFSAGGNGKVWIDDVAVSGPPPETPPTETPTVTPSVTPPTPVGTERVRNGSFENGFDADGVASSWTAWQTAGDTDNAYWKQSTLVGPAGGGTYHNPTGWYEDFTAMTAKVYLLGNGYGAADDLARDARFVDTIVIGRSAGLDRRLGDVYAGNWEQVAQDIREHYVQSAQYHPRIDAWCGLNEPNWGNENDWQMTIRFAKRFTELMHEAGLKTVILNMGVGTPGDMAKILDAREAMEVADFFGYHCYGGPNDQLMIDNVKLDEPSLYALRVRNYQRMYRERGWSLPPVVYTEGTTYAGWIPNPNIDENDVRDDIVAFIPFMNEDRWNVGMCIFNVGGGGEWAKWDITGYGIADDIGAANRADPVDKTNGLYSQQFGVGSVRCNGIVGGTRVWEKCVRDGVFTGGIVQQVAGLRIAEPYRVAFDFKYEFANGSHYMTFEYGLDWTGQTANPGAGTIHWSSDLILLHRLRHEVFQLHYDYFSAQATSLSLWFRLSQNKPDVPVRINLDTVSIARVESLPSAQAEPFASFW